MKLFEYLLKYFFYFSASIGLAIWGGPGLVKHSINSESGKLNLGVLKSMKIEYLSSYNKDYIKLKFVIDSIQESKIYYIHDNEFYKFEKFLCKNKLIIPNEYSCKISNYSLPLEFSSEQLMHIKHISYSINEHDEINYLECENIVFLGKQVGIITQVILITLGLMICIFGSVSFLIFMYLLTKSIIHFNKTGHFPELPNSINDAIEGWRSIFKKPKS
jgi:hypothetical protein